VLDRETSEDQELQHRSMISLQEQVDARAVDKDAAVSRAKSVKEKSERKYGCIFSQLQCIFYFFI